MSPDRTAPVSYQPRSPWLGAVVALAVIAGALPASARAAGSEWTAQQMFGTPYAGATFGDRSRYGNPQILPFGDGTAEGIWTDSSSVSQGIHGRHLGTDGKPTADAYDLGYPPAAVAVPRSKVAPLTGSLGVMVMDATLSDTQRRIYGRLLGPNGPVGPIFEISAVIGSVAVNDFDVVSNGDGTASVAWPEYDGTALAIRERQVDATGVSGPVVTVSDPLARPENTNAVNTVEVRGHGDGTASIAWSEQPNANLTSLKVRRVGPTGALGSVREIVSGSSSAMLPPRIAAEPDDTVTAVWGTIGSAALYVAHVSPDAGVTTPERLCQSGATQSAPGQQCLDLAGGSPSSATQYFYDIAATSGDSAIVVARRPNRDVVFWRVDSNAVGGPSAPLEPPEDLFPRSVPRVVADGQGSVIASWAGLMPSSSLPTLRAARIAADSTIAGDQTLFSLGDATEPAEGIFPAALSRGSVGALPIWAGWTDWTADPAQDPTTTRQVYTARYPLAYTPPAPDGCPAVRLIGVAGSGENGGPGTNLGRGDADKPFRPQLGPTVQAFRDALRERIEQGAITPGTQLIVDDQPVDYPAVPVGNENAIRRSNSVDAKYNTTGNYGRSVAAGVTALHGMLLAESDAPCAGKTHLVLAGYSQGAQVIGDLLEEHLVPAKVVSTIKSIALFGDPKFNSAAQRVTARSSFETSRGGQLGRRSASAFGDYPSTLKIHSYCRYQDPVCQDIPFWSDGTPHMQYPTAESSWGAWNTSDALFPGSSQSIWAPGISASISENASGRLLGGGSSITLSCRVPSGGVCWERATIVYTNWITGSNRQTKVVRFVGRDDDRDGVVVRQEKLSEIGRVTSGQADLTATAIGAGHAEKTAGVSVILR